MSDQPPAVELWTGYPINIYVDYFLFLTNELSNYVGIDKFIYILIYMHQQSNVQPLIDILLREVLNMDPPPLSSLWHRCAIYNFKEISSLYRIHTITNEY